MAAGCPGGWSECGPRLIDGCYPPSFQCDGVPQCKSGKDEEGCGKSSRTVGNSNLPQKSYLCKRYALYIKGPHFPFAR